MEAPPRTRKKKNYTDNFVKPLEFTEENGTKPVQAMWLDGYKAELKVAAVEMWPTEFDPSKTTSGLPKIRKKAKKTADCLWSAEDAKDGQPVTIKWRSSRGWLMSLSWGNKGQICQIKPVCYMKIDEASQESVQDQCFALMKYVATEFGAGKSEKDKLLELRDAALTRFGLTLCPGQKTGKRPAAKQAVPKEAAKAMKAAPTTPKRAIAPTTPKAATAGTEPKAAPLGTSLASPPATVVPTAPPVAVTMASMGIPWPKAWFCHESDSD